MKNLSIFLIIGFLLLSTSTGCYAAGPWRGKVIDAETKRPIEGVAVVAIWYKSYRGPAGATTIYLKAREALTDKEGKFEIPSYWALHIPLFREIIGPWFTIYKPGYGLEINPKPTISAELFAKYLEEKEGVIELPKIYSKEERKKLLIEVEAGTDEVPAMERKNLKKLTDAENVFLGLTQGK